MTISSRAREIMEAVENCNGNVSAAARELGISRSSVRSCISGVRSKGEDVDTKPLGFTPNVIGRSTLYGPDGETKLTWEKTRVDELKTKAAIEEAAISAFKNIPTYKPKRYKGKTDKDLIPWFQIGDAHLGMVAYHVEVGQNFDLKIAERELCTAMASLIDRCAPCERCVINDLGDMTHYENFTGITEGSGHILDYDSRYPKMINVYVRTMIFIVRAALDKFKYVDVIINQGNHSRTNDIWMPHLLRAKFDTKRLNVLDNSNVFIPYRMGNTFVMTHHSDKCKPPRLVGVMSTDYRHDFGEARYKYIDIGHTHSRAATKEQGDVMIECWNQLASRDKYAHEGGWRSRSFLSVVYRSKTYGEKGRETITAEEVKDMICRAKPGSAAQERRDVYTI